MNDGFLAAQRKNRTIISKGIPQKYKLTVFLGVHNGAQYLASLQKQLLAQKNGKFNLIVIDNASKDDSWEILQKWSEIMPSELMLVKNSQNLGGMGSVVLNQDLIQSEWVTFMHQDDYYKPSHVNEFNKFLLNVKPETVAFYSDMGSLNQTGGQSGSPVRASWLLPDYGRGTQFLANLKVHTVPFPSSAFRTKEFIECLPSWFSTAFPDTELILKLCAKGDILPISKETMLYRENEMSESHSVNELESNLNITIALCRIFASDEFIVICKGIKPDCQDKFASAVFSGIQTRLKQTTGSDIVKVLASEAMSKAWDHTNQESLNFLANFFTSINSNFSSNLLEEILGAQGFELTKVTGLDLSQYSADNPEISISSKKIGIKRSKHGLLVEMYKKYGYFIPYRIRRSLLKSLFKVKIAIRPEYPWNFKW